jgi:RNA polymerase sigma factor (sigma-70 family)
MRKATEKPATDRDVRAGGFDLRTHQGFERFAHQTKAWIHSYFARRRVPFEDIQDLAQDAIAIVWEKRDHVVESKAFAFLFSVTRRVHLRYMEHHARESSVIRELGFQAVNRRRTAVDRFQQDRLGSESSGIVDAKAPTPSTEDALRLEALFQRLSARQRQVMELVWIQGLPRGKAAKTLGIRPSTLRAYEAAAMAKLRGVRGKSHVARRDGKADGRRKV